MFLAGTSTWIQKMSTHKICGRYTEDISDIFRMLSCLIRCSVVIYNIEYPANLIKRFIYNYTDLCNQCFWLERQSTWIQKMFTQKIHRRYTEDITNDIGIFWHLLRCSVVIYNIEYPANLIERFIYNYTNLNLYILEHTHVELSYALIDNELKITSRRHAEYLLNTLNMYSKEMQKRNICGLLRRASTLLEGNADDKCAPQAMLTCRHQAREMAKPWIAIRLPPPSSSPWPPPPSPLPLRRMEGGVSWASLVWQHLISPAWLVFPFVYLWHAYLPF